MIDQRADTVDMSDDTVDTGEQPRTALDLDLDEVAALRAIGVQSIGWGPNGNIAHLEFYELTDGERAQIEISKLSKTEQAMYANMTEDEQAKALEKHRESLLYHSS